MAELSLQREASRSQIEAQVQLLRPLADAMQISDIPLAWTQMSALAASCLVLESGMDAVPVLTCRDRNRIALTSELLGLRALGVRSVILTRGHRVPKNHPLQASTVFDTTGRELVALANELNEDESADSGDRMLIGTGARVFRPGHQWRGESLKDRSEAGAEFIQTQLCFDIELLKEYMARLVELRLTWSYSVIVSLTPLPSVKTAEWIQRRMSDSKIPAAVLEQLEQADDQRAEGIALCAAAMREIVKIPGVSGINLMNTGDSEAVAEAIEASGLREP